MYSELEPSKEKLAVTLLELMEEERDREISRCTDPDLLTKLLVECFDKSYKDAQKLVIKRFKELNLPYDKALTLTFN